MRKTILLITIFLLVTFTSASLWAAPKISIPQSSYVFDSVPEGTIIKHSFIIKNNGDEPLMINNVLTG
ncbi:MAG: DUF1573 domain-containing protein [Desulfobacteraceae bacterium]|nr:DUF1573 domain-containing protein [Desulfobacteraceae bacterium]